MKRAVITGVTGQDGAYLSRFLLDKGYAVYGLIQRCEIDNTENISEISSHPNFYLQEGDLLDSGSLQRLFLKSKPDEVYNLGAQSHVGSSFETPEYTSNVNGLSLVRLFEAMQSLDYKPRFYQASSSELFGNAPAPQNEKTPMHPCSPYAIAKLYAFHMVKFYRDTYGYHASNGILFNHESPLRGRDFVTQKIAKAVANIAYSQQDILKLGNVDAVRDWGYAPDYIEGMWLMLQQDKPDDYVLATGHTHSVRELVQIAFNTVDINIQWSGEAENEIGRDAKTSQKLVQIDPKFFRPNEVNYLCGDYSKAKEILGWKPKTTFKNMIEGMVQSELNKLQNDISLKRHINHAA